MSRVSDRTRDIRTMWSNYQSSRVLLTANNYKVFDYLEKERTTAQVSSHLRTDKRATEILLDALSGMGLLKKQRKRYKNSRLSSDFLVSGKPYYQGNIIRHADALWDRWSDLDSIMKTGKPSRKSPRHDDFILGMHNLSVTKAKEVTGKIGLNGIERALDLGGGPATYTIELARKGIRCALFDLPETVRIAKKVVSRSGIDKRAIQFIEGDFLKDDIGREYDLILVSQILHMFSGRVNNMLLKKCRRALREKGRIVIQDFLINEARTHPVWSSLFSVNMLVNTENGRTYSPAEMKDWLLKAGFSNVRRTVVADSLLISATR